MASSPSRPNCGRHVQGLQAGAGSDLEYPLARARLQQDVQPPAREQRQRDVEQVALRVRVGRLVAEDRGDADGARGQNSGCRDRAPSARVVKILAQVRYSVSASDGSPVFDSKLPMRRIVKHQFAANLFRGPREHEQATPGRLGLVGKPPGRQWPYPWRTTNHRAATGKLPAQPATWSLKAGKALNPPVAPRLGERSPASPVLSFVSKSRATAVMLRPTSACASESAGESAASVSRRLSTAQCAASRRPPAGRPFGQVGHLVVCLRQMPS